MNLFITIRFLDILDILLVAFILYQLFMLIKGTVAFKGKVRGKCRIIHDPFKNYDFDEGDILITGMTRPEFTPFMKKAGAIVTDAGGLLCHAAITAREMKIPCIVGTEKATRIFKEGDIVEVDAENGVIRKI